MSWIYILCNICWFCLKAHLEFQRENYVKAMKLLTSCQHNPSISSSASSDSIQSKHVVQNNSFAYLNNMGCLYLKLERYGAALSFFQKAISLIETVDTASKEDLDLEEMKTSLMHKNHTALYYNCGLTLLYSSRPVEAFSCFKNVMTGDEKKRAQRPISLILTNVRMAECCIQYNSKMRAQDDSRLDKPPLLGYISEGPFRRIVLSTSVIL